MKRGKKNDPILLINRLSRNSDYYQYEEDIPVEWEGTVQLQSITKLGYSCLVIGEDGSGKATAATLLDIDNTEVSLILAKGTWEVILKLWDLIGRPIPPLTEFRTMYVPNQTTNQTAKNKSKRDMLLQFQCSRCNKHCVVFENYCGPPSRKYPDDIDEVMGNIYLVENDCMLRRDMVAAHVADLKNKKIVLKLPSTEKKLLDLLECLISSNSIIILANADQVKILEQNSNFKNLTHYYFPKPGYDTFIKIAKNLKIQDFADDITVEIGIFLSNLNIGKFLNLFNQTATMLGQANHKISIQMLIDAAKTAALDPRSMAAVALIDNPNIKTPTNLRDTVMRLFGTNIQLQKAEVLLQACQPLLNNQLRLAAGSVQEVSPDLINNTSRKLIRFIQENNGGGQTPVSQAQLAAKLNISKATVSNYVTRLVEQGYLKNLQNAAGKPALLLPDKPMPRETVQPFTTVHHRLSGIPIIPEHSSPDTNPAATE